MKRVAAKLASWFGVLALTGSFASAAEQPLLQWLPGEGLLPQETQPIMPLSQQPLLVFDLGGAQRKQLRLDWDGIQLRASSMAGDDGFASSTWLDTGENLGWYLGGYGESRQFRPLARIQCQEGTLEAGLYHGANCTLTRNDLNLGAGWQWQPSEQFRLSTGVFEQRADWGGPLAPALDTALNPSAFELPLGAMPGLAGFNRGVDLDLELGLTTDNAGDWRLGVQLARIMDGRIDPIGSNLVDGYRISESFETARVNVDWSLGDFSGGIASFYRAPVQLRGRESLDDLTTFDIYFSWQAPWNGNFSVGASNLFDDGTSDRAAEVTDDGLESAFGRIPYVRYRQDL